MTDHSNRGVYDDGDETISHLIVAEKKDLSLVDFAVLCLT